VGSLASVRGRGLDAVGNPLRGPPSATVRQTRSESRRSSPDVSVMAIAPRPNVERGSQAFGDRFRERHPPP